MLHHLKMDIVLSGCWRILGRVYLNPVLIIDLCHIFYCPMAHLIINLCREQVVRHHDLITDGGGAQVFIGTITTQCQSLVLYKPQQLLLFD